MPTPKRKKSRFGDFFNSGRGRQSCIRSRPAQGKNHLKLLIFHGIPYAVVRCDPLTAYAIWGYSAGISPATVEPMPPMLTITAPDLLAVFRRLGSRGKHGTAHRKKQRAGPRHRKSGLKYSDHRGREL